MQTVNINYSRIPYKYIIVDAVVFGKPQTLLLQFDAKGICSPDLEYLKSN